MAQKEPFNYRLDKITEREVVFDFVSRLSIGKDFVNQDYNQAENSIDKQIIIPADTLLKDGLLMQIIRTMNVSDIINLDRLKTSFKDVAIGDNSVRIPIPAGATLYKIIQEKTGQDVTACFTKSDNYYVTTFDVPMANKDIFKAYYKL